MSKRDEILALREAYIAGAQRTAERLHTVVIGLPAEAATCYPLTETRPREVLLANNTKYRYVDGVLQFELSTGRWEVSSTFNEAAMRVYAQIMALQANPTEEVPL